MNVLHALLGPDLKAGLFLLFNILLMETLLSVDNAAVLAVMVGKLPEKQRPKALEYGLLGAFVLRGLCLALVSFLISFWWLKIVGGLYLIYLTYGHFTPKDDTIEEASDPDESSIFKFFHRYLGVFWSTVALVEVMDLAFSIDNIFAVTAFTSHIGIICTGVFLGMICMRFVASLFCKLIEKFPFLEDVALVVIGFLGLKLILVLPEHLFPNSGFTKALTGEHVDLFTSLFTITVFILPVLTALLFGWPKRVIKTN